MHMKTEIMKYFVLLFCFSLAACDSDDKTKNVPDLNIVSSGLTIKAAGGTGTIEVETPGSWHAESNKDWCTLTTSGNQITVSVPGKSVSFFKDRPDYNYISPKNKDDSGKSGRDYYYPFPT